jgi:hypothetical protein
LCILSHRFILSENESCISYFVFILQRLTSRKVCLCTLHLHLASALCNYNCIILLTRSGDEKHTAFSKREDKEDFGELADGIVICQLPKPHLYAGSDETA